MKRAWTLAALVAAAWSATLAAQTTAPSLSPTPAPAADAPLPAGYKTVEPRAVADYPLPSTIDPRVCLEFPTSAQIIACAERYRPHRKRTQAPA